MKKKDEKADPAWALKTELTPNRINALRERIPSCETS